MESQMSLACARGNSPEGGPTRNVRYSTVEFHAFHYTGENIVYLHDSTGHWAAELCGLVRVCCITTTASMTISVYGRGQQSLQKNLLCGIA